MVCAFEGGEDGEEKKEKEKEKDKDLFIFLKEKRRGDCSFLCAHVCL